MAWSPYEADHVCTDCRRECPGCERTACETSTAYEKWVSVKENGGRSQYCPECAAKPEPVPVLVVDDDEAQATVLKYGLTKSGHEVVAATDMAGVITALTTRTFKVLILDMQGGDIDRLKVAEVARAKGIAIITMSGAHELRPVLEKPFRIADAESAIKRVIS